jgi:hypothetical protein
MAERDIIRKAVNDDGVDDDCNDEMMAVMMVVLTKIAMTK